MKDVVGQTPRATECSILLLGEGREEELFFSAFLKHSGISGVQIESYGGKSKLKNHLLAIRVRPGFHTLKTLIITRDADDSYAAAVQSIESMLTGIDLRTVQVQTFILPGKNRAGALEDLCFSSIGSSSVVSCIEKFLQCAKEAGLVSHLRPANAAKARMQSWLAVQDPPDLRLGHAASKLPLNDPIFDELRNFLLMAAR